MLFWIEHTYQSCFHKKFDFIHILLFINNHSLSEILKKYVYLTLLISVTYVIRLIQSQQITC